MSVPQSRTTRARYRRRGGRGRRRALTDTERARVFAAWDEYQERMRLLGPGMSAADRVAVMGLWE